MSEFFSAYFRRFGTEAYSYQTVLIELLLIGGGVYFVLRFLQGTGGARLLKGIGVLVLATFLIVEVLAGELRWQRIEFLYSKYVSALIIGILIVFQPELRRAIMRLGETRWLRRWTNVEQTVEALVHSVQYLSSRKIGAIIAIERDTGLRAQIQSGKPIDSKVTAELLNTIFWPGSALHDMGVIIRQNRVAAAGCQFPLAEGDDLPTEIGSRHRAALGLSQETDALIVVVSEETGTISVVEGGKLHRGLTLDRLGEMLRAGLGAETAEQTPVTETAVDET